MASAGSLKLSSLKGATITVKVELGHWRYARVRFGIWLMRLGAWITGAECRVEKRKVPQPQCGFCGQSGVCLVFIEASADIGICYSCHALCGKVMSGEP